MLADLEKELQKQKNPKKAKFLSGFFKTGKGQYGEGDIFLGITVPKQRIVAKKFADLDFVDIEKLLKNKIHEYRLTALMLLVYKYQKSDQIQKERIARFYLKNAKNINNWDLVDSSAPYILGDYLQARDRLILYRLAKSANLWERRIAILATFEFIKNKSFADTLKVARVLMADKHDLIHKATGWMLREVGKRDQMVLEEFLKKYYKIMPRTMLRYAIERFSYTKRQFYLNKTVKPTPDL